VPDVRIAIAGAAIPAAARRAVAEIRVQQSLSQPTLCELVWLMTDAGDASFVRPGAELSLHVDDRLLFSGDVTAIEYVHTASSGREVRVRAYDRLHRLRKRQDVRAYVHIALDELARELVKRDGLAAAISTAAPVFRHLVQAQQSDYDLLADLVARSGLYFWLDGTTLRLMDLASTGAPLALTLGDNLLRAEFELNADTTCAAVYTLGWDPSLVAPRQATANRAHAGRAIGAELDSADGHGDATRSLLNTLADDETQAQRAAQGELDRRVNRSVIFTGAADGDTRLTPGSRVDVRGVAAEFAGTYTVASVTHRVDGAGGFVCEFSTAPPIDRRTGTGAAVTLGIVTQVEDPENRGRIRVRLPAYNDAESGWLPVVLPGVGQDKGIVATPNIDDTVLLLAPDGDPSRALVIGGVPGRGGPVDAGVSEGQVRRFFIRTAGGLSLSFDDAAKTIRLQDAVQNQLELSPNGVVLHAATDLRIQAPGRSITILADAIDFERG
jgi:phage protein D/phage baseplate assembly protein gpV